jgi:hypothetical protein
MTDRWGAASNPGKGGMRSPGGKGPKGKKGGHKGRGGRKRGAEPLLEQPVAGSTGAVPCRLCGHPVDPKRMHFHMVRFHGASLRPGRP